MEYTYLDLVCYLLIYSFLGWLAEVLVLAVKDRRVRNRGFFNLPFCLSYGVAMDLLLVMLPTMGRNYLMQYVASLIVSSVIAFLSGGLAKRVSRTIMWKYQENNLFAGHKRPLLIALGAGMAFFLAYLLLHPVLFALVNLIPDGIVAVVCVVIAALLVLDMLTIVVILRRSGTPEELSALRSQSGRGKRKLGMKVCRLVWSRLERAYPDLGRMEQEAGERVFARGVCFDKLVWIFLIASLLGDLIETVFCRFTAGVWMSRSSLIYGTFSVVWGFGAVVLTVVLHRLADREDRWVFFAGFFIGGVYEYLCSVFTEFAFGATFWDYSDMPFNFGGRTNLLFCVFWGLLSVFWIKVCFPRLSGLVERIPPVTGKVLTWVIVALLVLDALISAAAMLRYVDRAANPAAQTVIGQFLDRYYDDALIEWVWPNIRIS